MDENDFQCCIGLFILLIFISVIIAGLSLGDPTNVTETITYKDISHTRGSFQETTHYNIYTENNQFQVHLKDYNQLQIGDNVTVEYNETINPILHTKEAQYYAE